MADRRFVSLPRRGVLTISGADRREFLQGLTSNDIRRVSGERAVHSAFLTPQGRYLHEFFVVEQGEALLLEGEAERLEDLRKRLSIYRLRSKVVIGLAPEWAVFALTGDDAAAALGLPAEAGRASGLAGGVVMVDPRLAGLGLRALLPAAAGTAPREAAGFTAGAFEDYDRLRLRRGVPDGSRDLVIEKSLLLENGFDELAGVDFQKGCYMGQELTARTKYRGLVRKRLLPVTITGPAPAPGTPVLLGEREAGEMRSSAGDVGLAMIRLEMFEEAEKSGAPFTAGGATLSAVKPDWAMLPPGVAG